MHILYADDMLIIAPSVSELQNIVNICEHELNRLDMLLNVKKILLHAHWATT